MQRLGEIVYSIRTTQELVELLRRKGGVNLEHVCDGAQAFVAACVAGHHASRSCWILCPDLRRQEGVFNGLLNWQVPALFFSELEIPPVEGAIPDPEIVAERLEVLRQLAVERRTIVVVTAASLEDQVPASDALRKQTVVLKCNEQIDREALIESLLNNGYQRNTQVTARGQVAVRGGIIDIFSWQHSLPVRIELFDQKIDSIREFDLDDQTSIQTLDRCEILIGETDRSTVSLRDYIRKGDLTIGIELEAGELDVSITSGARAGEGIEDYGTAFFETGFQGFEAGDFLIEETKRERALEQVRNWIGEGWRLFAICHNEGEVERLRDVLSDNQVDVDRIQFLIGSLTHGFFFPCAKLAVLCDAEIFGRYQSPSVRRLALRRSRLRGARAPIDFSEIAEGDLVVHLEHGIGRYCDIRKFEQNGTIQEVAVLEFANQARLYVPFEQAFLISRYVGVGKRLPPLSTLGDGRWSRAKKAAQTAVFDYAAKLLSIQAERNSLSAFAYPGDTKWQNEFETSFLYKETGDQLRAIQETKGDMESERPMDRLICGDVGFGKTEVAIRAAFKAVMSGKQVAMLVPTTVLAQQHYNTFRERMSDYPLRIAMLSRFLSQREMREAVHGLRDGSIDIVIGTHRLISGDIQFKNLGLVVIDEEQRFGVKQKERFKEQFKLIDVLTLSATPIPRTLYLSLVGAKDMSIIETPPPNRLPIETVVCAYDERVIRDAIRRECHRNGQVYFLHNRVETIERVQKRIQLLCPGARVDIGHGQMDEQELEDVMQRFVGGKTDVLVSTTIIESGLDIPNANTIIIDRADRFGLADLYQLRGRVGRAQHKAYAYLLLPREMMTVGAARRRINAIKQYSGLGAGFKIAMRDLEIRGAGSLLGTAQSGHIVNIGFDLYCQLLHQAVAKLKGTRVDALAEVTLRLDFVSTNEAEYLSSERHLQPAFIPADYMALPQLRIQAYKKLAQVQSKEALRELGVEWRDRFGPHPTAIRNLLLLNEARLVAARAKVSSIEVKESKVMLIRGGDYLLIGDRFPRLTSGNAENTLPSLLSLLSRLS
ncbi:MAG TPA: transcription-repair coupling factor [Chthoniobacterales bacterium]|jgi:transcription-repair coupling factor (superfamily II helicase)|nr:transcription-repair coupling factor [Chthoniobacterales bacterium]